MEFQYIGSAAHETKVGKCFTIYGLLEELLRCAI